MDFITAVLAFAAHLFVALALALLFLALYVRLTPHDELGLVRAGNTAAAIALSGAMIGFALVLSRAVGFSTAIWETAVWGFIALLVQIAGHYALKFALPQLHVDIERNQPASAILAAALAIGLGMLNAASMTP